MKVTGLLPLNVYPLFLRLLTPFRIQAKDLNEGQVFSNFRDKFVPILHVNFSFSTGYKVIR